MSQSTAVLSARIKTLTEDLATAQADYNESLDTIWMLLAALLVFFMHAGFSLLECGSVRNINVQNILTKNLIVVCLGFLIWYAVGWSFACAPVEQPNLFIGGTEFLNMGFWDNKTKFRKFFFQ